MIYLLDTNILIYLIKSQPPSIAQRIDALPESDALCMSFVTWAELLKGAERSTRKTEVLRRLNALARQVPVRYPTAPAICRHYAELATRLQAEGARDPQPDLHIRGDREVRYERVAQAMAAAQRAGVRKIGFVTDPQE